MPSHRPTRRTAALAAAGLVVASFPFGGLAGPGSAAAEGWDGSFTSVHLGTFDSGSGNAGAEIAVHDPSTGRVFVTNGAQQRIDVFSVADLSPDVKASPIGSVSLGGDVQSVAVKDGVVAAAVANATVTSPGEVVFFDSDADLAAPVLRRVTVGALPDMVTFTPDGTQVLVANEGEPRCTSSASPAAAVNPEGSISIIDVETATARTAGFGAFDASRDALVAAGVRLNWPGATVAQDVEPEYIAVSADGSTAWATLQEANAVAVVDVASATVTAIVPLGLKDHSLPGNELDSTDRESPPAINIASRPVFGMYMPDAIAAFSIDGATYLATANEGDGREYGFARADDCFLDEVRLATAVTAGNTAIPGAATLRGATVAGRLKLTNTALSEQSGGQYTKLASYGARSFSIWSADGELVFDSGSTIERTVAAENPAFFNANFEFNGTTAGKFVFDTRSDDKGPEPEAVAVGSVFGRPIAFVGLERAGGWMAFDVSDPTDAEYLFWERSTTNYTATDLPLGQIGDVSPESVAFVGGDDSPSGLPLVIVSNELSGTTSVFQMTPTDGVTLPGAPTPVTGTPGNGQVSVAWTAPADGGSPITGYEVTASPGGATCATATTSCQITGLTNGAAYTFSVVATTLVGDSAPGVSAPVTPRTLPSIPGTPAGAPADGRVALTWTPPLSDGGAPVTAYVVQYRRTSSPTWLTFTGGAQAQSASTSATVTGLTNGLPYTFRVAATNAAGTTEYTAASARVTPRSVPGAPTRVSASSTVRGRVALRWTAPNNGGSPITDYIVEWRRPGGTWTVFADGVRTSTRATVTGLPPGNRVELRVKAKNAAGTGGPSSSVTLLVRR